MLRSFLIYTFMFFAIVQSIPGSMQAVADHVIEPLLIQAELVIVDNELDVQCCDENNKKDATPCKSDCSAILNSNILAAHKTGFLFDNAPTHNVVKTFVRQDLRPPIA